MLNLKMIIKFFLHKFNNNKEKYIFFVPHQTAVVLTLKTVCKRRLAESLLPMLRFLTPSPKILLYNMIFSSMASVQSYVSMFKNFWKFSLLLLNAFDNVYWHNGSCKADILRWYRLVHKAYVSAIWSDCSITHIQYHKIAHDLM